MSLNEWLIEATARLKGIGIESARLDAEIILAHTIKQPRIYLHAHGDEVVEPRHKEIADARLDLRLDNTPIAYIIGHKEFYGRRFKVTTATLIPRPETEVMIELLRASMNETLPLIPQAKKLVDVGTGSGCLGITAKLEFPDLDVTLADISNHALTVAKQNATMLKADVNFHQGDLLRGYASPLDIILANLPYVDREWAVSKDTNAEPDMALYANNGGLALINLLVIQATQLLKSQGWLYLEADPRQHADIVVHARENGLQHQQTDGFIVSFIKP
jgi:release factor glutamine methyltransferase